MKSVCSCSLALVAGFILLTVMITITTVPYISSPKYWWSAIVTPHLCGVDPLSEPRLFTINGKYMNLSHGADVEWEKLMTPNGGFVIQPDGEGIMRKHGISMFHHLHCLMMIRAKIQRLMHLEQNHTATRGGEAEPIKETLSEELHWTHCIDYLRQGILCAADATIESPERGPNGVFSVTGNMVTHNCRRSERLYGLIEKSGFQPRERQDHGQDPEEKKPLY